jgi:hypothetical protein
VRANTSGSCAVNLNATSMVAPGATGWASGSSTTDSSPAALAGGCSVAVRSTPATCTDSISM